MSLACERVATGGSAHLGDAAWQAAYALRVHVAIWPPALRKISLTPRIKLNKHEPTAHLAVSPELEAQYLAAKHMGLLDGGHQVPFISDRHPKDVRSDDDRLWAQVVEEEANMIDVAGGHGVPLSSE